MLTLLWLRMPQLWASPAAAPPPQVLDCELPGHDLPAVWQLCSCCTVSDPEFPTRFLACPPPPAQVLDWELQGHDLPADWAKRVEGSSEFYGGLGFETSTGFQIVSWWIHRVVHTGDGGCRG